MADGTLRAPTLRDRRLGRSARVLLGRGAFPIALAILILVGVVGFPAFGTVDNFRNVLVFASIPCIIAIGQTIVILGRGVDLSVGSMLALSAAVLAEMYTGGHAMWVSALAVIALGGVLGSAINGLLTAKVGVSFIIVTLGTFAIFRSQAQVMLGGQSVTVHDATLDWLANGEVAGVPTVVLIAALVYLVTLGLLRGTSYGRAVYAVGANPEAARLAGIPVARVLIIGYGLSAALAAFAGILTVGQLGSAQPQVGVGTELISIAAVLLGGTRFSGGYGGVTGTVLGVLFLGALINLLLIAGVSSFWQGTASGFVLIAAVALDRTRKD